MRIKERNITNIEPNIVTSYYKSNILHGIMIISLLRRWTSLLGTIEK